MTVKEQVRQMLDQMPEDCSMHEVAYRLWTMQRIRDAVAEADDPDAVWIPHEVVVKEMREKCHKMLNG